MPDARKQAEIDYPQAIGESGRAWLRSKPFGNEPRESARLLIDFGHVLQLLDLRAGMSLCELGCGSGWLLRFAARRARLRDGAPRPRAGRAVAARRAELEAPLPGARGVRAVRRD